MQVMEIVPVFGERSTAEEPAPPEGGNTGLQQEEHARQASSEKPCNVGDPTAESGEASPQEEARSASASNPYRDFALFNLLRSRCILLLRGTWLLKRAGFEFTENAKMNEYGEWVGGWVRSGEPQPVPRRQELEAQEPEAYMTAQEIEALIEVAKKKYNGEKLVEFAVPVLALSYCWEGPDAPDPQGRVLQALAHIIADHIGFFCREDSLDFGAPASSVDGYDDVAVFIDFPSVHQKPRADTEEESFKSALKGMNVLYAHELTYSAILRGQDDHLAVPRDQRGWPVFEELMSCLVKETSVVRGGGRSKVLSNKGEQESQQRPPLASKDFDALLNSLTFTSGADRHMVSKLYRTALTDAMTGRARLQYSSLPWGDEELATLGRCLAEAGAREIEEVRIESLDVQLSEPGCEPFFDALASCTRLRSLVMEKCPNVKALPGSIGQLLSLQELKLCECDGIKEMPGLSGLASLKELKVLFCDQLKELPDLSGLASLNKLTVKSCGELKEMPDLSGLASLKELKVLFCGQLKEISSSFDKLASLETLELDGCPALEEIPDLSGLVSLKALKVEDCNRLKEMPDLSRCASLNKLFVKECRQLKELPDLSRLASLKELKVDRCGQLKELPDLSRLASLKELKVDSCGQLKEMPDLSRLASLKELTVKWCFLLKELPDLSRLASLKELRVDSCAQLKELPDLSRLASLNELTVMGCGQLKEMPDLSGLVSLKALEVQRCGQLKEIHLSGLASLNELTVAGCDQLKEIHVGNMDSLEKLELLYCSELRKVLPRSRGVLPNLKDISVMSCDKLLLQVEPFTSMLERPDLTVYLDRRPEPEPEEARRPACCCTVS